MTGFVKFSAIRAMTICAAFTMTAGLALAGDGAVPADQIIHAPLDRQSWISVGRLPSLLLSPTIHRKHSRAEPRHQND